MDKNLATKDDIFKKEHWASHRVSKFDTDILVQIRQACNSANNKASIHRNKLIHKFFNYCDDKTLILKPHQPDEKNELLRLSKLNKISNKFNFFNLRGLIGLGQTRSNSQRLLFQFLISFTVILAKQLFFSKDWQIDKSLVLCLCQLQGLTFRNISDMSD